MTSRALIAAVVAAGGVLALQTVPADSPLVRTLGRVARPGNGTLRASWVGAGVHVKHTGSWLRGTFSGAAGSATANFKVATYQSNQVGCFEVGR